MLDVLTIKNVALIEDMKLEFTQGMNVLTGETGAGKSFILKALNFLMGDKLTADMVRAGHERAQVEALFALPDGDLILRRELLADTGRSRLYINDQLSSQESVRALKEDCIVHTSQHGQHRLLQPSYQASLIDDWMQKPEHIAAYQALVQSYKATIASQKALEAKVHDLAARRELLELHLEKINAVKPFEGEEEELENQKKQARTFEGQRANHERALTCIYGEGGSLIDQVATLERALNALTEHDETMPAYIEGLYSARLLLQDLSGHLRKRPDNSPKIDLEHIEARLYTLAKLKRSLHRTMPEILELRDEIETNFSFLDVCGLEKAQLEKQNTALREELATLLQTLNAERTTAAAQFTQSLEKVLLTLGFSEHVRVFVAHDEFEVCPPTASGKECIEHKHYFMWAPNPGQQPQRLDRIASGGELSRFMLAVVSLQQRKSNATLIFDEVDAGVGGITLNRVAEVLYALAEHRQMLLITHWPQLATQAARHFYVYKTVIDNITYTHCDRLEGEAKEAELRRMAGIET